MKAEDSSKGLVVWLGFLSALVSFVFQFLNFVVLSCFARGVVGGVARGGRNSPHEVEGHFFCLCVVICNFSLACPLSHVFVCLFFFSARLCVCFLFCFFDGLFGRSFLGCSVLLCFVCLWFLFVWSCCFVLCVVIGFYFFVLVSSFATPPLDSQIVFFLLSIMFIVIWMSSHSFEKIHPCRVVLKFQRPFANPK